MSHPFTSIFIYRTSLNPSSSNNNHEHQQFANNQILLPIMKLLAISFFLIISSALAAVVVREAEPNVSLSSDMTSLIFSLQSIN